MQVGGLAGTCFWMLAAPSYPDHDGFTIYLSGEDKEGRHSSAHRLLAAAAAQQGDEEPASPFAAAAAAPAAPFGGARPGGRTGHVIRQHAAAVAQLNGRLSPLACQLCEAISRHASGALASRQASGVPAHAPYAPAPGSVPAAATAAAASHTPHIHAHARGLGCRCCDIM